MPIIDLSIAEIVLSTFTRDNTIIVDSDTLSFESKIGRYEDGVGRPLQILFPKTIKSNPNSHPTPTYQYTRPEITNSQETSPESQLEIILHPRQEIKTPDYPTVTN